MQVFLQDLAPGQSYALAFRSNDGKGNTSEWSQVQRFTTTSDTMPPANVQGLSVFASGSSVMAQWNPVTKNGDGTTLLDFRYYHIRIVSVNGGGTADFYSLTEHFELTQSANITAFGAYQTALTFYVTAVDMTYNESVLAASVAVDPAAPPVPSTPVVSNYIGLLLVSWDGNSSAGAAMPANTVQVQIHASTVSGFTPSTSTQVGTLDVGTTNRKFVVSGLTYGTTYYIKLIAVNSVNKKSAPSAQASGTPTRISGLDIANGQISASQINFTARDIGGANAYFGTSKPTVPISPTGFKTGDIWYDTGHGYATYRYDSTAADFVTAPEIGVIAGTKILTGTLTADAVGTNLLITSSANIGNAVIDQANIGTVNAASIVAGIMSADVVLGGRFATALSGARVEVNSIGLQKFDVDGVSKLVSITGTEALLTGIMKTANAGRRIEIGASGQTGEITYYAPNGVRSRIFAATYPNISNTEAINLGIPIAGADNDTWNYMSVNNGGGGGNINLVSQTVTNIVGGGVGLANGLGYQVLWVTDKDISSPVSRLTITTDYTVIQASNAGNYLQYGVGNGTYSPGDGTLNMNWLNLGRIMFTHPGVFGSGYTATTDDAQSSPAITMFNNAGYGSRIHSYQDARGQFFEFFDWSWTTYVGTRAAVFQVSSDEAAKTEIAPLATSALDQILSAKVKKYRRKGIVRGAAKKVRHDEDNYAYVDDGGHKDGPVEIGLIAQEAPAQIRGGREGHEAIDLYQMSSLMWAALHEIHDRITKLEDNGENNE